MFNDDTVGVSCENPATWNRKTQPEDLSGRLAGSLIRYERARRGLMVETMHELSLILSMMDMIQKDAYSRGIRRINKITIEVGEFSGAFPHALEEAFFVAREKTVFEGAHLDIKVISAEMICGACGKTYRPGKEGWSCPFCHSSKYSLKRGMELQVVSYTGEEAQQ